MSNPIDLRLDSGIRSVTKSSIASFPSEKAVRVSKAYILKVNQLLDKVLSKLVYNALIIGGNCRRVEVSYNDIKLALETSLDKELAKYIQKSSSTSVVKFASYTDKDKSTRAHKAGLAISVSTVEKSMRSLLPKKIRKIRLSQSSIIYTTAALEHIIAEIADIARLLLPLDKRTLTAEVFDATLAHDAALGNLLKCTTILYR